jgi:hypothetical protein
MFGFFGNYYGYHADWEDPNAPPEDLSVKEERFIDYCMARWGAYVDMWELLNERNPPNAWTQQMASYVHANDPLGRPVSTSWERPSVQAIDIDSPHWYESEDETQSDLRVHQQAALWKATGKTVIVGEQGNTGMNWDPRSATRMRIRLWTSWFEGIGLVFWNTSWAKDGVNQGVYVPGSIANIYLGPEERGYVRVLRDTANRFPAGMVPCSVEVSAPDQVRAYAMHAPGAAVVFLQHSTTHGEIMQGLRIRLNLPAGSNYQYLWLDPYSGGIWGAGQPDAAGWLTAGGFYTDVALMAFADPATQNR